MRYIIRKIIVDTDLQLVREEKQEDFSNWNTVSHILVMETTFRIQVGPSYHSGWMRLDGESKKEYIFSYLDNFRKNNQTCTCTSASALCGISFTFLKIRELHNKYVVNYRSTYFSFLFSPQKITFLRRITHVDSETCLMVARVQEDRSENLVVYIPNRIIAKLVNRHTHVYYILAKFYNNILSYVAYKK